MDNKLLIDEIVVLKYKLKLETGLHIGGNKDNYGIGGIDSPVIKNPFNNQPIIPGSSLKGKITIILTTHYMEEAEALSDRIGIMKNGKLLICETAENIKKTADTQNFEEAFIRIVKGVSL